MRTSPRANSPADSTAASADEVASAIAYLASDEAAIITGIVLPVDGGQTCTDGGPEWGK
ncbi:SDR family oxidoreductase [Streptomyces sp. NPDC057794]